MKKYSHTLLFMLVASILMAGCAPLGKDTPTSIDQVVQTGTPTSTGPAQASSTPPSTSTPNPQYSPTPDVRLKPEQWRDWPIVPAISPRAAQIYEQGLAMGNDPHAFSKVGDCQSITEAFLGVYEKPGQYSLGDQYQYLQDTIDYYKGSFGRESQSVRGGFNAAAVLLPLWADPNACNSGETPLECELRIHKPSIVIISLEVWFKGRTPETYTGYMRQIIDYAISKGVLPVLATKADNVEGDNSINLSIAQLAYEYDLPMWNFWRAVQSLPAQGIDWVRDPEGFHITVDAWNMRSFTALEVLDTLRHDLAQDSSVTPLPGSTPLAETPDPAFTPGPLAELPYAQAEPFSTSAGKMPFILFDLTRRSLDHPENLGLFSGDLNGAGWDQLASAGAVLLDVSPDGAHALLRYSNQLYSLDLATNTSQLLSDQLTLNGKSPAYFLQDGQVAAILQDGGNIITILSADGSKTRLTGTADRPLDLVPSQSLDKVYWYQGSCDSGNTCQPEKTFVSNIGGGQAQELTQPGLLSVSPDGALAFVQSSPDAWNYLTLVKGQETKSLYVPGNRLIDMAWSPDGSTLALSTVTVSDYSGKITENFHTLVTWPAVSRSITLSEGRVTEKLLWSPDGKSLLVMRRETSDTGYHLNFNLVDASVGTVMPGGFSLSSTEYLDLPHLFWLEPSP